MTASDYRLVIASGAIFAPQLLDYNARFKAEEKFKAKMQKKCRPSIAKGRYRALLRSRTSLFGIVDMLQKVV